MKILVAEDEALLLKTMAIKLGREGYEVVTCNNGTDALQQITDANPDLVITDMNLPWADGLTIVKTAIEAQKQVMVLSGMTQTGHVQTALDLGACDFLEKPFSLQELTKRVAALVTK